MNKTGPQLLELSPEEGFLIQEKYVAADALYSQIKEDVRKRAQALDEAISQSTQVFGSCFFVLFCCLFLFFLQKESRQYITVFAVHIHLIRSTGHHMLSQG